MAVAKEDFRVFLWIIFRFHLADISADPTPLQYDIATYLMDKSSPYKVIEAFRGLGKSYIACLYCIWRLWRDNNISVLVLSAAKDKSDQNSTFMLRILAEVPFLNHMFPHKDSAGLTRRSKVQFDVCGAVNKQAPSVKSVGILGQITGSRADIILADDIEIPRNSNTPLKRSQLKQAVEEFAAIERTGGKTEIIFLGTPQSCESVYLNLPKGTGGYQTRLWPAEYPPIPDLVFYGNMLAPTIREAVLKDPKLVGRPTDTRFNAQELAKRKAKYGRSGYALQFMLNTRLSDDLRYPLKISDLVFFDCDRELRPEKIVWGTDDEQWFSDVQSPGFEGDLVYGPAAIVGDWVKYDGKFMWVDPSGKGADETGYSVVGVGGGFFYLLDNGAIPGGYSEAALTDIAKIAKDYGVHYIAVEENFGGGMFAELLRPVLQRVYPGCGIEDEHVTGQKELRIINTLEPVMNGHKLIVNKRLLEQDKKHDSGRGEEEARQYHLFFQMTRITKERNCLPHDDRLDSLAGLIMHLQDRAGRDVDVDMRKREDEIWRKYILAHLPKTTPKNGQGGDAGWAT